MLKSYVPPPPSSQSDGESSSSEEDSSSDENEIPSVTVPDNIKSDGVNRKERVDPLRERLSTSGKDLVRKMPEPTVLTTARMRNAMFGATNTEITQIAITDPVLYVALYSTGEEPSEVDDFHWVFIVGPSHEDADAKGTLYNMEPRQSLDFNRPFVNEWQWSYNQPTIPLRGQTEFLARLMIAEVTNMDMLQAIMLRWGETISMREHVEWMSVKWVKTVLKSLDKEEDCLGRRMESFESVEAKGRWLAESEEEKRKGYCLLDTRISTRALFERDRTTALSSTATVDVAIKYPVLYVGVYASDRSPHENDEYHWAFLIGPSNETAESEGVCCGVTLHLDPTGWPTWSYNQTIVPLRIEDDLLLRMLIADIVDLGPVGEIIRDRNVTPTAGYTGSKTGGSEYTSITWVREQLEMLERKPECFSYKCSDFSIVERYGRKYAKLSNEKRKKAVIPIGIKVPKKICLVSGWKRPDEDENQVFIKLDLAHDRPNTISRAVQIITGVLGATALEMRRQIARRKYQEQKDKQEVEPSARSKQKENTTILAERTKPRDVDKATDIAKNVGEQGATARSKSARVTTSLNLAKSNMVERASEGKLTAKVNGKDVDQSKDDDDEEGKSDDEEDKEDEESEDDDEDSDGEDDKDEGEANGNTTEKKANAMPDHVRGTTIHFEAMKIPDRTTGGKNMAEENERERERDESEDEEEDQEDDRQENNSHEEEDEEDDGDNGEDEKRDNHENETSGEEDSEDGEEDSDEDEEDERGEYAGAPSTVKKIPSRV